MPGFIHDKLEIKFLILYITARVIEPIPFDTVWDLAMCDEGVDYFDFAECLSDLVRTEHLTLSADGLYAITDKGLRNSRICESSLPYSVRLRCDKNLAACNRHLRRKSQVKASTEKRPNGTYTVRLELSDDMGSVMDLRLAIPREDMAAMLTERFQKSPERLYGEIMRALMSSEPEEAVVYTSLEGGYEELAVLRMADAEAAAAALEAVQAHVSDRRESEAETQYKPEDLPKLEKALTEQAGNTVLLVVCADYDAAQKALDALGS